MPIYNGDKWIEESIEAILGQSMTDFELIISDNASTDNTEAICRRFAERDPRVRYYRNVKNIGLYPNFNRVFELANGKYFKWAADSDICRDGFFEQCVGVLESRPDVVLVYPRAFFLLKKRSGEERLVEYFDDFHLEDKSPSTRFRKYLNRERNNNIMHGIIRVSALRQTRLHLPWAGSDISMVSELALRGKFIEVQDRLFVRRFDAETSSMIMNRSMAAKRDVPMGRTFKQRFLLHAYRYLTTIGAPIAFSEKVRVLAYLSRDHASLPYKAARRIAGKILGRLFGRGGAALRP
jgi:glycosyltransferase involved in cell wall biosynthesis